MMNSVKSFGLSIVRNIGPGIGLALGSAITIAVLERVASSSTNVSAKLKAKQPKVSVSEERTAA